MSSSSDIAPALQAKGKTGVMPDSNLALQVTAPFTIEIKEVPLPALQANDVLLAIAAVGICGTDMKIYDGTIPYLKLGGAGYPIIPGHEWSAYVVKTGSAVEKFQAGELVVGECHQGCNNCEYCRNGAYNMCPNRVRMGIEKRPGALALYAVTDQRTLHHAPAGVSPEEAALTEPATVAFHGLQRMNVLGKRVAVLGCGPIGLLSVEIARLMGASAVVAVDVDERRAQLAGELGADVAFTVGPNSLLEDMRARLERLEFDVVVEVTGVPQLIDLSLQLVRPRGEILLLSLYGGKTAAVTADYIVTRELSVVGTLGSPSVWERTIDLISAGRIQLRPLISHRFTLQEGARAFELLYDGDGSAVKVLVKPNSDSEKLEVAKKGNSDEY